MSSAARPVWRAGRLATNQMASATRRKPKVRCRAFETAGEKAQDAGEWRARSGRVRRPDRDAIWQKARKVPSRRPRRRCGRRE